MDLHELAFDAENGVMSGISDVVGNDPYELRIFVPTGNESFVLKNIEADGKSVVVRQEEPLIVVVINSDQSESVRWSVRFNRGSRQIGRPQPPAGLTAEQTTRGVALTWQPHSEWIARYRLYRDGEKTAELDGHEMHYVDSQVLYGESYEYVLTAVDALGAESDASDVVVHQTPLPASTNLTDLIPIFFTQEHASLGINETVDGKSLRVNGRRYYTGLGTHSHSRVRYFLGGGYDVFSGSVGIDDEIGDRGSAVFEILVDGKLRWRSDISTGKGAAKPFQITVAGKRYLDLVVNDGGDGCDYDHADWLDPYLRVLPPSVRGAPKPDRVSSDAVIGKPTTQPVGQITPKQQVVIETSMGNIVVELDTDRTEATVRNFLGYVDAGSYDDTIMHRVIEDYIVQGGGYDERLQQMPSARPINNQSEDAQSNRRGTIAMARQLSPDSATREFFFNLADNTGLDYPHHNGGYCVFGRVVEGMDVLDQIGAVRTRQAFQFEHLPADAVLIRSIRRK
jgi:cyclophilin family peptidyl-prolyl cis-trans isomerase